jgi:hypothetical protein
LPATTVLAPSFGPLVAMVGFSGIPGLTYSVQRAPTPTGPWTTIATVPAGATGLGSFMDTNPPAGKAFYRNTYP